jgi:hypothetical protein
MVGGCWWWGFSGGSVALVRQVQCVSYGVISIVIYCYSPVGLDPSGLRKMGSVPLLDDNGMVANAHKLLPQTLLLVHLFYFRLLVYHLFFINDLSQTSWRAPSVAIGTSVSVICVVVVCVWWQQSGCTNSLGLQVQSVAQSVFSP